MSTKKNLSLSSIQRNLLKDNKGKPISVVFDDGSSFIINTKNEDLRASLLNALMSFVEEDSNGIQKAIVDSL